MNWDEQPQLRRRASNCSAKKILQKKVVVPSSNSASQGEPSALRSEAEARSELTKAKVSRLWLAKGVLDVRPFLSEVDDAPVGTTVDRLRFVGHERLRAVENGARRCSGVLLFDFASVSFGAVKENLSSERGTKGLERAYLRANARMELGSSSRTRIGLSAKICSPAAL